jgi:hypothetical protein
VLGGCIVEGKEEREEYLRVERSSLNSIDKEEAGGELVAVVLGRCHEEKIEEGEEYLKELVVLLVLAWGEGMMTEDVEVFLLDGLDGELTEELNRKMFDTKLLSGLNFSGVKGFFDIKPLSGFSFAELSNSGNVTE